MLLDSFQDEITMDWVRIRELELDCIVGLRPHERTREQRVRLDLAMALDTRQAALRGDIEATVDYDRIANEVVALLRFRRYRLVEMAADELCAMLLGCHPRLATVRLQLEKPGALEGRARAAAVEIERSRADYSLPEQYQARQVLLCNRDAELVLHRIEVGGSAPRAAARERRALSWVVSGALVGEGRERRVPGLAENCEPTSPNGAWAWQNDGAQEVRLFRCALLGS